MTLHLNTLYLCITLLFLNGCLTLNYQQSANKVPELIYAKQNSYFPGTGIGRGTKYQVLVANHTNSTISLDSLQTNLHFVPFDGKKIIKPADTLLAFAFGLIIDTDIFPDFPPQPFKGDSLLGDSGIIYFTIDNKVSLLKVSHFEPVKSEFYE